MAIVKEYEARLDPVSFTNGQKRIQIGREDLPFLIEVNVLQVDTQCRYSGMLVPYRVMGFSACRRLH